MVTDLAAKRNLKLDILIVGGFLALYLVLFFTLPIHEFGHYLFAKLVGIDGNMSLQWPSCSGVFVCANQPTGWLASFVGFGGGGFQALVILGLWLIMPLKRVWYISFVYFAIIACFLVVGILEML